MSLITGGPLAAWQAKTETKQLNHDSAQLPIVTALQALYQQLVRKPSLLKRLLRREQTPPGIYIWGDVGRGKTMLMDLFYDSLPSAIVTRLHFHRFMQQVHLALQEQQHQQNPLTAIARQWASCKVLCFDEFHVSDIADAMLLGELLQNLFDEGVVLIATSNSHPDNLYNTGLQQDRFKPAIAAIKQHCQVLELDSPTDYRLRLLAKSPIYHSPPSPQSLAEMQSLYAQLNPGSARSPAALEINTRTLLPLQRGEGVIWFDFSELCEKPRGSIDYISIARAFNSVFISGLPAFDELKLDALKRFINLVDEFYDHRVKLVISADVGLAELYTGKRLAFEFKRTRSRLYEMQSQQYLALAHRP